MEVDSNRIVNANAVSSCVVRADSLFSFVVNSLIMVDALSGRLKTREWKTRDWKTRH